MVSGNGLTGCGYGLREWWQLPKGGKMKQKKHYWERKEKGYKAEDTGGGVW